MKRKYVETLKNVKVELIDNMTGEFTINIVNLWTGSARGIDLHHQELLALYGVAGEFISDLKELTDTLKQ